MGNDKREKIYIDKKWKKDRRKIMIQKNRLEKKKNKVRKGYERKK